MGDSVAGKIRIDLLANVAQFKAGMREAGREGLGSFQEEVRLFNQRGGGTQGVIASQIANEKAAWKAAMLDVRRDRESLLGVDRGTTLRFNALSQMNRTHDLAQERQIRLRNQLPFGMSTRTELSRADVEAAAMYGRNERSGLSGSRSLRGLGMMTMGRGTLLPFHYMEDVTEGMSAATKGVGLFAAGILVAHAAAAKLGREIQQTREEANRLGMTYDEFVKKQGMTEHWRFTEGAALGATKGMGGLKGAGAATWGGFVTAVDYTVAGVQWAAGGKFRPGSQSAIAEMARIEEENLLKNKRWTESQQGINAMQNKLQELNGLSRQVAKNDWIAKFSPTNDQIKQWEKLADAITLAQTDTRLKKMAQRVSEIYGGNYAKYKNERADLIESLAGVNLKEARARIRAFDAQSAEIDRAQTWRTARDALKSARNPEQVLRSEMADINFWRDQRIINENEYHTLRMRKLEDYYETKTGLDRDSARHELQTPGQRWMEQGGWIRSQAGALGWGADVANALVGGRFLDVKRAHGISTTLDDYKKSLGDLGKDAKLFSPDEVKKARKRFRRAAFASLMADEEQAVSPTAAMAFGSREAHATIVQSQLAGKQVQLAIEANRKLDAIERNTNNMLLGIGGAMFEIGRN